MAEYCITQVGNLQDFNMVKIESRPQTMKISVIGSENYSGM
jgi:hypothetical protein